MKTLALSLTLLSFSAFAENNFYTISNADFEVVKDELSEVKVLSAGEKLSLISLSEGQVAKLSTLIHNRLGKCGGFKAHESFLEANSALAAKAKKIFNRPFMDYSIDQHNIVDPLLEQVNEIEILKTIIHLTDFENRYYRSEHGVKSSHFIKDLWTGLTKHRSDASVEVIQHKRWPQPSIILTITGSETPGEIVILGGHADSITMEDSAHARAPGADDNASGIASITEVIRVMMNNNFRPKKTIQFMAYAAEEVGLWGSAEIAKSYKKSRKNVIGVMQLDMTLFKGTADKDIVLIKDETHQAQNDFVAKLIDEYVKVPWGWSLCGYACSDHASWTANGYPSSFPFEANFEDANHHVHTENDTIQSVGGQATHSVKFSKLATAFLVEMAN